MDGTENNEEHVNTTLTTTKTEDESADSDDDDADLTYNDSEFPLTEQQYMDLFQSDD